MQEHGVSCVSGRAQGEVRFAVSGVHPPSLVFDEPGPPVVYQGRAGDKRLRAVLRG